MGAGELSADEDESSDDEDESPEVSLDEDDEDEDVSGVLVPALDDDDDVVLATDVDPIEPSKTITPQARTNADSVAATTVRRIRATRRARSARRARPAAARSDGWGVGMRPS
jgi:hypothetical protein